MFNVTSSLPSGIVLPDESTLEESGSEWRKKFKILKEAIKTDLQRFVDQYPDVDIAELLAVLPRIQVSNFPELSSYSWEDCYEGFRGAGGLFLVSEMANLLDCIGQPDYFSEPRRKSPMSCSMIFGSPRLVP